MDVVVRLDEHEGNTGKEVYEPEHIVKEHSYLHKMAKELLVVVSLNRRLMLIASEVIGVGTSANVLIKPLEVFRSAVANNAECFMLLHNHPSGDSTPSGPDIEVTKKLVECGDIMQIPFLDHIVFGQDAYTSMRDAGTVTFFNNIEKTKEM